MRMKSLTMLALVMFALLTTVWSTAFTTEEEQLDGMEARSSRSPVYTRWGDQRDLGYLVSESDLVFHGTVQEIRYKLSEPTGPENVRIPYTFITYSVAEVLHGHCDDTRLTLRFFGGLNEERMEYMSASILPQIDLGDEDLLFVTGNGSRLCPLVGNQSGRLRVVDGQVYSETGRELVMDGTDTFYRGARYALEEIMSATITSSTAGSKTRTLAYGANLAEGPSDAAAVDLMLDQIRRVSLRCEPQERFTSADITARLSGPDMTPAAPPEDLPAMEQAAGDPEAAHPEYEEQKPLKSIK